MTSVLLPAAAASSTSHFANTEAWKLLDDFPYLQHSFPTTFGSSSIGFYAVFILACLTTLSVLFFHARSIFNSAEPAKAKIYKGFYSLLSLVVVLSLFVYENRIASLWDLGFSSLEPQVRSETLSNTLWNTWYIQLLWGALASLFVFVTLKESFTMQLVGTVWSLSLILNLIFMLLTLSRTKELNSVYETRRALLKTIDLEAVSGFQWGQVIQFWGHEGQKLAETVRLWNYVLMLTPIIDGFMLLYSYLAFQQVLKAKPAPIKLEDEKEASGNERIKSWYEQLVGWVVYMLFTSAVLIISCIQIVKLAQKTEKIEYLGQIEEVSRFSREIITHGIQSQEATFNELFTFIRSWFSLFGLLGLNVWLVVGYVAVYNSK